jgi:hypothetical protein
MSNSEDQFVLKTKALIKTRLPIFYQRLRLAKGFFAALVEYKKVTFDQDVIEHIIWCKIGEGDLNALFGTANSHRNPLKLDIISIREIRPSVLPAYLHYNPTLQVQDEIIRIFWRVSDFTFENFQDEIGKFHTRKLEELENFERIATAVLETAGDADFGRISHERVLPEITIINREQSANEIGREPIELFIEDPRAHEGTGRYLTAHARFGRVGKNFYRMIVIDLATNSGIIVSGADPAKTEKNWVVIQELEDSLVFLNQSKPLKVDRVKLNTGISESLTIDENEDQSKHLNLNGGTPFVRLDSKHFIRVARLMFPIFPLGGCRISVLVLHDLDFKEVARSKPFIFNKLGVEICNGLVIKDDLVYFSWGQDDTRMYVGKCSRVELMLWFNQNLQN